MILAALSVTHMLTSIVAFLSVGALWAARVVKGINLALLAGVLVAFWTLYGAMTQLQSSFPAYIERAFHLDMIFQLSALGSASTASDSLMGVAYVRYIFTAVVAVLGLTGFLLSRKYRDKADLPVLALLVPAVFVLLSMLYGSEFWARTFLFSLVPVSYFAVKMLRSKTGSLVLCTLLLAALPFSIISHYGFAAIDNEPPAERAYWHFAAGNTVKGDVFGGTRIYYPDYTYSKFYTDKADWEEGLLVFPTLSNSLAQYVHVGETDSAVYGFSLNDTGTVPETRTMLEGSPYYSLIYANTGTNLYFHQYRP